MILTADQIAAKIGVTGGTVRRRARIHNIGTRLGRDWLFTAEDMQLLRRISGKAGRPPSLRPGVEGVRKTRRKVDAAQSRR